jgi:hypothetical protein
MPLLRSPDQGGTLEEHYAASRYEHSHLRPVAAQMLSLIKHLQEWYRKTEVWGLTSHLNLSLMAKPDSNDYKYVHIEATGGGEYTIGYLIPPSEAPWPKAHVIGYAKDIPEALKYIAIATRRSGGWPDSTEC